MSRLSTERRLRFSVEQDLQLLREAIRQNPFEDVDRWKEVHENFVNECNVPFSLRTCKDHCNHLLNLFLKESLKIRPKESPQQFAKKKKYLEEILELRKKFNADNIPRRSSRSQSSWDDETCDDPMKTLLKQEIQDSLKMEDSDDDFYWKEPDEKESDKTVDIEAKLRKQELALEERKVALKERKLKLKEERFELDKMERAKRMEMEKTERDMYMRVVMQNQSIIAALMDKYNKKNGSNLCIL